MERQPVRLQTMGLQSVRHGRATNITDISNTLQTLTTLYVKVTYLKQDSQRLNCLITVSKDSVRNTIEVLLSIVTTPIATIVTTSTTS